MDPPSHKRRTNSTITGLGHFSKLPYELRRLIWLEFLPRGTLTRPNLRLQVLCASKQLRYEIEHVLYQKSTIQFDLSSNYYEELGEWDKPFTTVIFKTMQIRASWKLKADKVHHDEWFNRFPFHKIQSVEVNLFAAGLTQDAQLLWLWRNVTRAVSLLAPAISIPPMTIRLLKCEYENPLVISHGMVCLNRGNHLCPRRLYPVTAESDLLCREYATGRPCHDILILPFYTVPNIQSINIETHSDELSKSMNWSRIERANILIQYRAELNAAVKESWQWAYGRTFHQFDNSRLIDTVKGEWDSDCSSAF